MVSVVVCTYNRSLELEKTLASLRALSVAPELSWELVVVDNRSTDNTAEVLKRFTATSRVSVRYVFEPEQGLSFARNTGIRTARGELLVFTDDDVVVHEHWLTGLLRIFAQFDCIGVAGRVVPIWRQPQPEWLGLEDQQAVVHFEYGEDPRTLDLRSPVGANMAFRRAAFEKYGLFRVDLGKTKNGFSGLEDAEFGSRLLKAGEKIVYAPQAIIYHPVEPARVRKNYILRWAYSEGRHQIRSRLWPQHAARYFGIPRYLFGSLLRNSFLWAVTRNKKRRFQHGLQVCQALGSIREAWRLEDRPLMCDIPSLESGSTSLRSQRAVSPG